MSSLEMHDTKKEASIEAVEAIHTIPNKLECDEADMLRFGKRQQMKVHPCFPSHHSPAHFSSAQLRAYLCDRFHRYFDDNLGRFASVGEFQWALKPVLMAFAEHL